MKLTLESEMPELKQIGLKDKQTITIGRLQLPKQDMRCSKSQIEAKIGDNNEVQITVRGKNPSFIKLKDGSKKILKQGQKLNLESGDTVYLLADEYPFRLETAMNLIGSKKKSLNASIDMELDTDVPTINKQSSTSSNSSQKKRLLLDEEEQTNSIPKPHKTTSNTKSKKIEMKLKDEEDDNATDEEPSWKSVSKNKHPTPQQSKESKGNAGTKSKHAIDTSNDEALARALAEEESALRHQSKYSSSPTSPRSAKSKANKKLKDEDDFLVYNKSSDEDFEELPKTKKKKTSPKKPPCKYGAACYRKNPDHLKQYSHPTD